MEIIIVTWKMWNLSLTIQGNLQTLMPHSFGVFAFLSTFKLNEPWIMQTKKMSGWKIAAVLWNKMISYATKEIYF